MKNFLNTFKTSFALLFLMGVLSACLPMEKKTQCGKDEAFNATKRKCVPVVGAASTNTVFIKSKAPANSYTTTLGSAGVSHTVSVSDAYNYGYSTKWKVHFISSVSAAFNYSDLTVSTNTLAYTFLPPAPSSPQLQGSYVLEVQLLDEEGDVLLDSVSWSISVSDQVVPQIQNQNPTSSTKTFASNVTTATFSADINNPALRNTTYTWYINSAVAQGPSVGNSSVISTSLNFDPKNDMGIGIHTVELKATDFSSGNDFDSYIWVVNVVDPDRPIIASGDPAFTETIIAVDGESYASGGYFYGGSFSPLNASGAGNINPGLCVTVDNYDKNLDGSPDLDVKFDINGEIQGATAQIGATNRYCLTTLNAQNLVSPQIGVSKTITVSTFESGTSTLVEQKQWPINIVPKNQSPVIQINTTTGYANMTDCSGSLNASGCSAKQSSDDDGDDLYDGSNDQSAPGYTINDIDNGVQIAIDVRDVETYMDPADPQYGEDQLHLVYEIKKDSDSAFQSLDGDTTYSKSVCSLGGYGVDKTPASISATSGWNASYKCDLRFDAYRDSTGQPIAAGNYVVRAYVIDPGSQWAPGSPQQSQPVTWTIAVEENQTLPLIEDQDPSDNSVPANLAGGPYRSYIEGAASCAPGAGTGVVKLGDITAPSANQASENEHIIVHTLVKDVERDNLTVSLTLKNGAQQYVLLPPTTVTNTYNSEGYIDAQTCFKLPEYAVSSGSAIVDLDVVIDEITDVNVATTVTNTFKLYVNNDNPVPYFDDYTSPIENIRDLSLDASETIAEPTVVYAGFPFTIDPPPTQDASVYDGKVVTWQWQVCVGNIGDGLNGAGQTCDPSSTANPVTDATTGWANIPGANNDNQSSPDLIWTPSLDIPSGSLVNLRICLGDDGAGNPSDCTGTNHQSARKTYTNITAVSNKAPYASTATVPSSGNDLAMWHDSINDHLYTAYAAGTTIYVEKHEKDPANGSWVSAHVISFQTEDTIAGNTPEVPSDLSMDGLVSAGGKDSLLIAYKLVVAGSSSPQIRVRRVDITDGRFAFWYGGLFQAEDNVDDQILTDANDIANTTFTSSDESSQVDITFTAAADTGSDNFQILLSDGSSQSVDDFCASSCATDVASATTFYNELLANPAIAAELDISVAGATVTLRGAPLADYVDHGLTVGSIGDIVIDKDPAVYKWYVPYTNVGSNDAVALLIGDNADQDMSFASPSFFVHPSSSADNSDVEAAVNSLNQIVIAARNTGGNLDVYLVEENLAPVSNVFNVFNMAGYNQIEDISLAIGSSDHIFVASKSVAVDGRKYVNAAVINGANLTQHSSKIRFLTTDNFLMQAGVDQVKIEAHPSDDGVAVLAITTSTDHYFDDGSSAGSGIPNQAHLALIKQNTANFSQEISFYDYQLDPSADDKASPKLNSDPVKNGAAIAMAPIFENATRGHQTPVSGSVEDNVQPVVFFAWHENNGTNVLGGGMFNASLEENNTNSSSVTGSFPAILSN